MGHLWYVAAISFISIAAIAQETSPAMRPLPGLHGQIAYPNIGCDAAGNSYVPVVPPKTDRHFPVLHRISASGRNVSFGTDRPGFTMNAIGVAQNGEVVTAPTFSGVTELLWYRSDGSIKSRARISEQAIGQVAPFADGKVLINSRKGAHATTSIFGSDGRLVARVVVPDDENIESQISRPDDPNTTNRAVDLGLAASAPDGNVYLLRNTPRPILLMISSDGKVNGRFELVPPEPTMRAVNMQIHNGLAFVTFVEQGWLQRLVGYDLSNGDKREDFDLSSLKAYAGCYADDKRTVTYFKWDSDFQMLYGTAKVTDAPPQ